MKENKKSVTTKKKTVLTSWKVEQTQSLANPWVCKESQKILEPGKTSTTMRTNYFKDKVTC